MAEKVQIDFTVDGAPAAKTLGDLETKAEQLNAALRGAEIGSAEYKKLNQQLVETNREVKNLELGFEALDNEQVASEIGSVAGAVGDVTAAMVLLGGENETLEEMAKNIETALGVSMAFKGAIEGFSSAWKLFNNVLKASPIFLLVAIIAAIGTGIAALITYWDEFVDALVAARDFIFGLFNGIIEFFTGTEDAIQTASMAEKKAHEQRVKQQKEITALHKERLAQLADERKALVETQKKNEERLDREIQIAENLGQSSRALTMEKLQNEITFQKEQARIIKEQIASWRKYYEDLFVMSGKSREDFIKQMKGQGIDLNEALQKEVEYQEQANNQIRLAESELSKFKRELAAEDAAEKEKIAAEELEKEKELLAKIEAERQKLHERSTEILKRRLEVRDEIAKMEEDANADAFQVRMNELRRQHEAEIALLNENIPAENALKLELEELYQAQLLQIKEEAYEADLKAQREAEDKKQAKREESIELAKQGAQDLLNAAEELANFQSERELKRLQEKVDRGEELTKSEIKRLKRQDKINKAFAVAQIAADTARGISGAIAAGASLPFPANLGAIASGVAAVLSGAVQAAQVLGESVEIPQVDTETGASADTSGTEETPDINEIQFGSTLLNQPQKVFVVESDITAAQGTVSAIEESATFG